MNTSSTSPTASIPIHSAKLDRFCAEHDATQHTESPNAWVFHRADHTFTLFIHKHSADGDFVSINISVHPHSNTNYPRTFTPLSTRASLPPLLFERLPFIRLFPEDPITRFAKRIGLDRKTFTGDHTFDDLIYVESETPHQNIFSLLEHVDVRTGLLRLFEVSPLRIELFNRQAPLQVYWSATSLEGFLQRFEQETFESLTQVAQHLPPISVHNPSADPSPVRSRVGPILLPTASLSILTLGVMYYIWRPISVVPLVYAALAGVLLWALGLAVLLRATRSMSGRTPVLSLYATVGLCAFTCGTAALFFSANIAFDSSPPTPQPGVILYKAKSNTETIGVDYIFTYREHNVETTDTVNRRRFIACKDGDEITVHVGRGFFGVPWYAGLTPKGQLPRFFDRPF